MNWWDIAVRLDSATKTKYSKDISLAMCEEAELLYKRNYLEEAIALFEKAKETDDKLFEIYKESYSNLLFDYGEDQIIKKELKKGIANLNYSFVLTDVNKIKIENKLNSLKRSKFLSSSLAIIPGLSQFIYQNGLTKPILLFGSFFNQNFINF